jgi:hypothetical protein
MHIAIFPGGICSRAASCGALEGSDQIRDQLTDIVGEIDVFGEAVDDLVDFGQRRAAFEGQVRGRC